MKKSLIFIYVIIMLIMSGCYNTPSTTLINNEEISIKPIDKDSGAFEDVVVVTMLDESINDILKQDIKDVLVKVGLAGEEKKLVAKYSLGMKQRLGIAQAIMEDPEFLILDEPMNGLDKEGIEDVRKLLLEMKAEGKTMIITSHNEEDIKVLCDKVIEMDKGKMVDKDGAM